MKPSRKCSWIGIGASLVSVLALLLLVVLPTHRYEWMANLDPASVLPDDPSADDRKLFARFLLLLVLGLQGMMYRTSRGIPGKGIAIAIAGLGVAIWALRWLP